MCPSDLNKYLKYEYFNPVFQLLKTYVLIRSMCLKKYHIVYNYALLLPRLCGQFNVYYLLKGAAYAGCVPRKHISRCRGACCLDIGFHHTSSFRRGASPAWRLRLKLYNSWFIRVYKSSIIQMYHMYTTVLAKTYHLM